MEETEEDVWEGGKLAWQVKYQHADLDSNEGAQELSPASNISTTPMAALSRLRHRLEVIFYTSLFAPSFPTLRQCSTMLVVELSNAQVRKDDVQTVVPISKSWSLMNTAVLTGRQVLFNLFVVQIDFLLVINRCRNQ